MKNIKYELEDRGLLYQYSHDTLFDLIDKGNGCFYCGFDPTASSLHLGNFIGFMVGVHLMRRGNKYIALTGGATGMIGDPGGKDSERIFTSSDELNKNEKTISKQISHIFHNLQKFTGEKFKFAFVNNNDFYKNMGYIDFLRDVGKYITVNGMISKDSVKRRIEDSTKSISYTEFSYMLLQGYDFCRLFEDQGVKIQIGGQDQWGNLVTGTELIRKKYNKDSFAFTWPLITDSIGKKFGKSEGNALFLDKKITSPYKIYQYFINTSDNDIEKYLKMLTLIDVNEIHNIIKEHEIEPQKRKGQKILAFCIVEIIHSTYDAQIAEKISLLLFEKQDTLSILQSLDKKELQSFFNELGGVYYTNENLFETIVKSGLANSHSQARQAVKSGSIYINENIITDFEFDVLKVFEKSNRALLRKGKKNFRLLLKK